jgi:tetratricopeptide (TPR) repeat protein
MLEQHLDGPGVKPSSEPSRTLRIFISSTFRDMQAERELLIKRVFPELRRLCAERFVTFTEVDLRWGITEEQAAEGQVLPICLDEIERSRPFFVGILGERYGWISREIPKEVIDREPWLQDHIGAGTSVTELEILHGVIRRPVMHGRAFFYFRDPGYLDRLPPGTRRADFESEGAEAREKLQQLKARIREARSAGVCQLVEGYSSPEALAEAVRADLIELIDWRYPKEAVPDPLEQEAQGHAAYAQSKRFAYVERPSHAAAIDAAVAGEGPPLVVTGDSGGGKTALLASSAARWAQRHPDQLLFEHYFGATPQSASATAFLQRLLGELKRRYDIDDEIPVQPDKLPETLALWLAHTVGRVRILLVLDGLNHIEGDEPERRLAFLPRQLPRHVRVVASTLPGPALDAWHEREWAEHPLPLPDTVERERMIDAFLNSYRKTLRSDLRRKIIAAPGAANALFLRTVLEELRQFGSFEELPARVNHYLEAETPEDLFRRVLRRWRADFDAHQDLVHRSMCLAWAARQGLAEAEWLELLETSGQPVARQIWRSLLLAMEPHLVQRTGLYAFGHDFLRRAVEEEFVAGAEDQRAAHGVIADYFERQPGMTPRKAAEWPWQLAQAAQWPRLHAALTTGPLFLALFTDRTKWELRSYWLRLKNISPETDMAKAYLDVYESWTRGREDPEAAPFVASQLAVFLAENGAYSEAEAVSRYALQGFERSLGPEHPRTLTCLQNRGGLLDSMGKYSQAEAMLRQAVEVSTRLSGPEHPTTLASTYNLAQVLRNKGEYERAEELYRSLVARNERVMGPEHPNTLRSVSGLAGLMHDKGDDAQAEALTRRVLDACERSLGHEHPQTLKCLQNLGVLLNRKGDDQQAEAILRRALAANERVLGPQHPTTLTNVNNLAALLEGRGDYAQADTLCRRALHASEQVLGPEHPATLMRINNLGVLLQSAKRYTEAEVFCRRALEASERVLGPDHPDTLQYVKCLGEVREDMGDRVQAESLLRRTLDASDRVLGQDHPDTLTRVGSLAGLLQRNGEYGEAEALYRRKLLAAERRSGPDHPSTLQGAHNLAALLMMKGDGEQADVLARRALEGRERILGPDHHDTLESMTRLALVLEGRKDHAQAATWYRRALEGRERTSGANHSLTLWIVKRLGSLLYQQGDYEQAEPLLRRLVDTLDTDVGTNDVSALAAVNDLATVTARRGDYERAEQLYRRALAGFTKKFGPSHRTTVTCLESLGELLHMRNDARADELEAAGQLERALPYREAAVQAELESVGPRHPDVAVALNNLAVLLRRMGLASAAEPHLRRAIEIERGALPADSPKHAHRLNNLCTVLIMQAKFAESRMLCAEAWALKVGRHDVTSARILIVRLMIALLKHEPIALYLGQLKTLFTGTALETAGDITTIWDIESFLVSLRNRLSPPDADLVECLVAALNDRARIARLDLFPVWTQQPPLLLDAQWPEPQ